VRQDRVTIRKAGDGDWQVFVPPTGPESFDTDGVTWVDHFGDSYWYTFEEAVAFAAAVLAWHAPTNAL
jgi:hypothetical protein